MISRTEFKLKIKLGTSEHTKASKTLTNILLIDWTLLAVTLVGTRLMISTLLEEEQELMRN